MPSYTHQKFHWGRGCRLLTGGVAPWPPLEPAQHTVSGKETMLHSAYYLSIRVAQPTQPISINYFITTNHPDLFVQIKSN